VIGSSGDRASEADIGHLPTKRSSCHDGSFPGDYFIHEFDFDGQSFFACGLLRSIDGPNYRADYMSRNPPSKPTRISKESHRVVGRISKRAYQLARLRQWPNSQAAVSALIDFSAGKKIPLSFSERFRLLLVR
jgi:hypothetical protein